MNSKIILFDIDGTIFNSDQLANFFWPKFLDIFRTDKKTLDKVVNQYFLTLETGTDFNPNDFLSNLASTFQVSKKIIEKVFYSKEIYIKCIYPEVKSVLEKLQKEYILGIFSEGFNEFQSKKLKLTELMGYFETKYVFIFRRKLSEENLKILPSNSLIIDNSLKVIKDLPKNINRIWINRNNENSIGYDQISDLNELITNQLI